MGNSSKKKKVQVLAYFCSLDIQSWDDVEIRGRFTCEGDMKQSGSLQSFYHSCSVIEPE